MVDTHQTLSVREPFIVLTWLTRLRWLAVAGQVTAVLVVVYGLGTPLPALQIGIVIGTAILTNILAQLLWCGMPASPPPVPGWVVPSLLMLDVWLLTMLLYFTGGSSNPFSILYLIHVAVAVVALNTAWVWAIVTFAALCYTTLFFGYVPLDLGTTYSDRIIDSGQWLSVILVAVLTAYFIGRVQRTLRLRERELIAVREAAVRNERLAALTTLAAGAAHELNTPLGTIALVARELELEARRRNDNPALTEDLELIRQEVNRCRRIIDRMRVEVLHEAPLRDGRFKVPELVAMTIEDLDPAEAPRLVVNDGSGGAVGSAPIRPVQQALVVLVNNAFDAVESKARQEGKPTANDTVALDVEADARWVRMIVTDRGEGMSPEVLKRAGEPFYTTKPPGKGMGMGLFLVRLVAEKYSGSFTMESRVGEGTRATLALPRSKEPSIDTGVIAAISTASTPGP